MGLCPDTITSLIVRCVFKTLIKISLYLLPGYRVNFAAMFNLFVVFVLRHVHRLFQKSSPQSAI
jgi:hypothetical protein